MFLVYKRIVSLIFLVVEDLGKFFGETTKIELFGYSVSFGVYELHLNAYYIGSVSYYVYMKNASLHVFSCLSPFVVCIPSFLNLVAKGYLDSRI